MDSGFTCSSPDRLKRCPIHSYVHTFTYPYIHTFTHSYIHTFVRHALPDIVAAAVLYLRRQKTKTDKKQNKTKTDRTTPFLFFTSTASTIPWKIKWNTAVIRKKQRKLLPFSCNFLQRRLHTLTVFYTFLHFFTQFSCFFEKNMYAHPPVYVPLRMLQAEYLKKLLKGDFSIRHRISFNAPYDVPSVE